MNWPPTTSFRSFADTWRILLIGFSLVSHVAGNDIRRLYRLGATCHRLVIHQHDRRRRHLVERETFDGFVAPPAPAPAPHDHHHYHLSQVGRLVGASRVPKERNQLRGYKYRPSVYYPLLVDRLGSIDHCHSTQWSFTLLLRGGRYVVVLGIFFV